MPGRKSPVVIERRPTMMDVAAVAGVSQATVSLVLNGSPGVKLSIDTRRRVQQAAKTLGYHFVRRGSARGVDGQAAIVFIADELTTDPWMALAFEGARDKALESGATACLALSHGDADIEAAVVEQMNYLHVVGFIYGTILTRQVEVPAALLEQRTMLLNCYDAKNRLPSVLPDDLLGGQVATEHLLQAGRRRIALINGQQGLDASRDRLNGYRQALAGAGITFDASLVRPGNWEPSSGYEMTLDLMAQKHRPDAIFCANDMMALGCFDALSKLGLSVPNDVSVIGFDDRELAQFAHPPLTTLVLPHYEMGQIAATTLLDAKSPNFSRPDRRRVECRLIDRNSVRVSRTGPRAKLASVGAR